jgi:hypothetical protein
MSSYSSLKVKKMLYWLGLPRWSTYDAAYLVCGIDPDESQSPDRQMEQIELRECLDLEALLLHFSRCGLISSTSVRYKKSDPDSRYASHYKKYSTEEHPPIDWINAFELLGWEMPFSGSEPDSAIYKNAVDQLAGRGKTTTIGSLASDEIGNPTIRDHISNLLATLNQAAFALWKNADKNDRTTHPSNAEVEAWLVKHGFSQVLAKKGATIIRLDGIPKGRPPEK